LGEQLILPRKYRPLLREPVGEVITGEDDEAVKKLLQVIGDPIKIISVGDVTTYFLLKEGVVPDISFVDDKTKREPAPERVVIGTKVRPAKNVKVINPAGTITEELINVIVDAVESEDKVRIFVDGEEDLAALPSIVLAPIGSAVLYGQPNEGIVLVKITDTKRKEVKDLLLSFTTQPENEGKDYFNIWRKLNGNRN